MMLSSSWFQISLYKVWFRVGLGFEYHPDDNVNLLDRYIYIDIDSKIYRFNDI